MLVIAAAWREAPDESWLIPIVLDNVKVTGPVANVARAVPSVALTNVLVALLPSKPGTSGAVHLIETLGTVSPESVITLMGARDRVTRLPVSIDIGMRLAVSVDPLIDVT